MKKDSDNKLQITVSASKVGQHFKQCCERFTAYSMLNKPELIGWTPKSKGNSSNADAGLVWEWDALCLLEEKGIPCYALKKDEVPGAVAERVTDFKKMRSLCNVYKKNAKSSYVELSADQTIEILRDPQKFLPEIDKVGYGYIYQARLDCTDTFLDEVIYQNPELKDFLMDVFTDKNDMVKAKWNFCKPDLIKVSKDKSGGYVFSIIDLKHAKHAKMEHKVQVAIYAVLLSKLFKELDLDGTVDLQNGYLWNFKRETPVRFDLAPLMHYVDQYFRTDLPNTLKKLSDDPKQIFEALPSMQCEWCDNFEYCLEWQRKNEPVTLMPYLTKYSLLYARKHNIPLDLDGFEAYTADEQQAKELKDGCLGWKRALRTREQNIEALRAMNNIAETKKNEDKELFAAPLNKDVSSLIMPVHEDVKIILTAQRDEATDSMYVLGIRVVSKILEIMPDGATAITKKETKEPTGYYQFAEVFLAKKPDEIDNTISEFIECLYTILNKCNDYNGNHADDQEKLSVQSYVMDVYEQMNLEEMILEKLLNDTTAPNYRDQLLSILFWLMGEHMITDVDEQAEKLGADFPLVVLTGVVKSLFSIPAFISYDMETICDALISSKTDEKSFLKFTVYDHKLSNTMKSDRINDVWSHKVSDEKKVLEGIRKHILVRLRVEDHLISAIREKAGNALKRWPEKFNLPGRNTVLTVRASKLMMEHYYEDLLSYHAIRQLRMNDLEELADEGQILKLRLLQQTPIEKNTFKYGDAPGFICICEILNKDSFFQSDFFMGIVLKAGDDTAQKQLIRLTKDQEKYSLPQTDYEEDNCISHLYSADSIKSYTEGGVRKVSFQRFQGFDDVESGIIAPGTEFYMVPSYKDLNGIKVEAALKTEGERPIDEQRFLYPETVYSEDNLHFKYDPENPDDNILSNDDLADCLSFKPQDGGKDFAPSQKKAFEHFFFKNLTLLIGPPGTGKTDFIARSIITLCKYYKSRGKNLAILLSANSHSAINNILSGLADKKEGAVGEPLLYKLDKWDETETPIPGVTLIKTYKPDPGAKPDQVFGFKQNKPVVLGATCWKIQKSIDSYNYYTERFHGFDVVVIDEASQVRTMDSVLMMQSSKPVKQTTRFLIVGDEDQLSPVLLGSYNVPDQPIDIYASIFRLYYNTAKELGLDYMRQLEEQFRMNEILSRYPAKSIYDTDIVPGDGRNGYHAFDFGKKTAPIAKQKLKLSGVATTNDELIRLITDPEYPLIVCRIHEGEAGDKRNEEISLVTKLVYFLKDHLCDPSTGRPYASLEELWGSSNGDGGLGIISPHHEQINRLKDAISLYDGVPEADRMNSDDIFIGTVDKLQGRQREAVIVSYGVADPEKASAEMEFIYSRNRLNVAMTRGKKKTICILSDTLLDHSIETLNVDDANTLAGITHMTGLLEYMQTEEDDTEVDNQVNIPLGNVIIDVYRKRIKP